MTDLLSLDRFRTLADAYGGVIARWPEQYRAAAMRVASTPEGSDILAQASSLDNMLDGWRPPAAAAALADHILLGAPVPTPAFALRARLWWSGIGMAAALAGAAAGAVAVAVLAPIEASPDSATAFGDMPQGS
jgi:hypothetical protein